MHRRSKTVFVLVALCLLALQEPGAADMSESPQADVGSTGGVETRGEVEGRVRPLSEEVARIRSEYDSRRVALFAAMDRGKTQRERNEIYGKLAPDEVAYSRRMMELVDRSPADLGARDALLWVLYKPGMSDHGAYGDQFARAAALLVRHHGDDPKAVCVGMDLYHVCTARRDQFLMELYAAARGHESKGLARLALAQYLEQKSRFIVALRKTQGRQNERFAIAEDGSQIGEVENRQSNEEYAYQLQLRLCDPNATRAEAERLYEEVAGEYGDVPYVSLKSRLRKSHSGDRPAVVQGGELTTDGAHDRVEREPATRRTLADIAVARLDAMHNLIVGKEAPEIDGVGIDGSRLKLSDHRGKVVLVFWGSWCGPCMENVPHERRLAERLKGKPFALLGVNCDFDRESALKAIETERITWPNWFDGEPGEGPIVTRYRIRKYPTMFILDTQGIIRGVDVLGTNLDDVIDKLLK